MMFNVKGKYKFLQDEVVILEGENLITFLGESFLLNRCINDEFNPMKYIVIGNGDSVPLKSDVKLGNELNRRTASRTANLVEKSIDLVASFTASEIVGVSEIGVANDEILISHDVFKEIESRNLINPVGSVEVIYSFQYSTATIREGWSEYDENIYQIYEPSNIILVYENLTKNGYVKVNNIDECKLKSSSYYYDVSMQVLFVHTSDGNHPESLEIIIQSK